ncbi:MAG: hypothetical protein HWN80_11375 [Candidatus Lokiarchaeota archaeon]|nr:hypothetical protein [Candidatus Lokiarchaeota archaeon]
MLKTYIFDEANKKWIEEDKSLLYHDLCAILDEERNTIYLWNGPKSSQEKLKKGYGLLESLMSYYPTINFQLLVLKKKVPNHIQNRIDIMLYELKQKDKKDYYKFSRFATIRSYLIFLLVSIILPVLSFVNLISSLFWIKIDANFKIGAEVYDNWLLISFILIVLSLIFFSIIILIGIIEIEYQVIVFSLLGILVCGGLIAYLQQGIFLFLFQEGSSSSIYYIKQNDMVEFLIVVALGIIVFEVPNVIKLFSFIKTYRKFVF